jgi:hypothetical protein
VRFPAQPATTPRLASDPCRAFCAVGRGANRFAPSLCQPTLNQMVDICQVFGFNRKSDLICVFCRPLAGLKPGTIGKGARHQAGR